MHTSLMLLCFIASIPRKLSILGIWRLRQPFSRNFAAQTISHGKFIDPGSDCGELQSQSLDVHKKCNLRIIGPPVRFPDNDIADERDLVAVKSRKNMVFPVVLGSNIGIPAAELSSNVRSISFSRMHCLAYLVCSPSLLEAHCNFIEEMELVNALCRLAKYAERKFV